MSVATLNAVLLLCSYTWTATALYGCPSTLPVNTLVVGQDKSDVTPINRRTVLRPQVGGRFGASWSLFRASQIQHHGLWCQVRNEDNAGMGSNIGDFYYPTGDGPNGFTLVPTSASNSAPYVSLKCANQIALVVDGDVTNNQGFVKCNSTIPNLNRDANYWVVYSDTLYDNYNGPTVDLNMTLSVLSPRDAVSDIEYSLSFNVSFGPPSALACTDSNNNVLFDARGLHSKLTRQIIRSRYISASEPDTTRVIVTLPPQPKKERTYTCTVTVEGHTDIQYGPYEHDTKGTGYSTATVTVAGTPTGVTVNRTAATSVMVSWSTPSTGQGLHVGGYEIFYQVAADSSSGSSRTSNDNKLTLTGLILGETYSIFVVAYGPEGAPVLPSSQSNKATIKLSIPQLTTTALKPTSSSIMVSWTAPQFTPNNYSILLSCQLLCGSPSTQGTQVLSDGGATNYLLAPVAAGANCSVSVVAVFGSKSSNTVTSSTITTSAAPTVAPGGLTNTSKESRSLSVVWASVPCPNQGGPITGYRLRYSNKTTIVNTPGEESRQHMLTGLTPFTRYYLQVAAVNDGGTGPYSTPPLIVETVQDALNVSVDQGGTPLLAGTSRSLSCSICSPVASANFTWMENGSPVNTSDSRIILNSTANTSTLQFNPLHTSDGGQYQCVATVMSVENFVDLTDQIDLNVTSVNTSFDDQGAPFLAGTTRSLSCFVDPPVMSATFIWFLGDSGNPVNTSTRVSITNTSNTTTLQFSPLRTSDGSRYQCGVMMIDGTSVDVRDEIELNVTISISSVIITTVPNDTLYADTFSDFICNATLGSYVDTPTEIIYQWLGPDVLTVSRYIITNNVLHINGFVMTDNNMSITCVVTVTASSGSMYVLQNNASVNRQLVVEALTGALFTPRLIIPVAPTAGDSFSIICRLDGVVERLVSGPVIILSYIVAPGGLTPPMSRDGLAYIREQVFASGMLSDVGIYRCLASIFDLPNSATFNVFGSGILQIRIPSPQVTVAITPSTTSLYEGTAVNLTCSATLDTTVVGATAVTVTSVWTGPDEQQLTSGSHTRITIVDMFQSVPYTSILMFTPADDTDTGTTGEYQCRINFAPADNNPNVLPSMNNATKILNITALPSPEMTVSNEGSTEAGQSSSLICTVTTVSLVIPNITWIRIDTGNNRTSIMSNTNIATDMTTNTTILTVTVPFTPVTFSDRGMYQCVLDLNISSVTSFFITEEYNITVKFPPPMVIVQLTNSDVPMIAGTLHNLTCAVILTYVNDINVNVDFIWFSNMIEHTSTNRITTYLTSQSGNLSTFTSTLMFNPLDDSLDSRMYRCNVSVNSKPSSVFITPTTATNTTTIDVQSLPPPTVMVSSTNNNNNMLPGSSVTLTCVVGVVEGLIVSPEVAWTKRAVSGGSDTTLNIISVGPVRTNTTLSLPLMFNPINTSDAGQYTCTATVNVKIINITVTNSSVMDVELQIPSPTVSLMLSSASGTVNASSTTTQTHLAGSTLNITCDIDIPDSVNTMFSVNIVWTRNGNNPMSFGMGSIMSDVSNTSSELNSTSSSSATSEINPDSRFVVTPAQMTSPTHYQTQLSFSTLSINMDTGQYVCTISIDSAESLKYVFDSIPSSDRTNVIVEDPAITNFTVTPPMVAVLESTCLDSQLHDGFTLVCTARKPSVVIPELGVQWLHNGTVRDVRDVVVMATENGAFITNILNVTDAEVSDPGLYQCVATIRIPDSMTVSTNGSINVVARAQSLPNTPAASVVIVTPTTVDINIVIANIAYTRETYHVRYNGLERDTDMDRSNTIYGTADITAHNSTYTITLTGLEEDTIYNYTVTAGNCIGNTTTTVMNFKTLSVRPATSPMNCSSPTFFSTNTTLQWIAPLSIDQNGDITGYNLTCPNVRTNLSRTLSSSNTTITITAGIVPFMNYSCSLTAINMNGSSPMTTCFFETAQDTPEDAPQNLRSIPTMTSIMYHWTPPTQPNGIITLYTLTAGGGLGTILDATTQSYLLCGLQPSQLVRASISASTFVGPGPLGRFVTTTDPEANSGVTNLLAQGNGATVMTIAWSPPANRHGFIDRYRVTVLNNVAELRNLTRIVTDTMCSFAGDPGVPYYIFVYPIDTCGTEGSVMATINFTKQEQARMVPDFSATRSDDGTMMVVRWTPLTLEEARGFISYRVSLIPADDNRRQSSTSVIVGSDQSSVTFTGLDPRVKYAVSLDVINNASDIDPVTPSSRPTFAGIPAPPLFGIIAGVLVALILAIIAVVIVIIIIVILCKKKKGQLWFQEHLFQPEGLRTGQTLSHTGHSVDTGNIILNTLLYAEVNESNDKVKEAKGEAARERETRMNEKMDLECMRPIDKASFHERVQEMHMNSNAGFEKEYLSVQMQIPGLAHTFSSLDCNKSKNRFANIFPYDYNRVTLTAQEGVEGSDYINASFVDGYSHTGAYIGAQGPLPSTIADFWRMIWEYKAVNIVMLTSTVEAGKKKCEQYWPEKIGETFDPRNGLMVTLHMVSHMPFSDFIIRNLKLSKPADETSKALDVNHFHFTAWPDHGVPQFATSLISFIGQVQKFHKKNLKIPLLVHSSAGVGRTGTFIMLDTIMDRLRSEDSINVYELLLAMRKQRMHMVQTQAQYVFIHDALDELITCGETDIAASNLRARVNKMHKIVPGKNISEFSEQFQLLKQVCYKPGDAAFSDSTQPYNLPKNRYPDKLPYNVSRPRLRPVGTNGADYINASFVDGYKQRNAYLVTQGPLKSTVNDLWQMIWEFKSRAIVLLCNTMEEGEEKCYRYWPLQKGETAEFDKLKVTLQSEDPHEEYVIRKLHVCNEKGFKQDSEGVVVTQLHYTAWPEHSHPSSTVHIMELMELLTHVQMKSGNKPITVMCNDGVGRSGTFLCIHSQLERLKTDGEVDAFKYLKTARTHRQGLVAELDHYVFCHEVLADYVESFNVYVN